MNSGNSLKSIGENLKAAIGKNPALATDPNIQGIIGELRSQEVSGAKTKAAIMQLGQGLTDYNFPHDERPGPGIVVAGVHQR